MKIFGRIGIAVVAAVLIPVAVTRAIAAIQVPFAPLPAGQEFDEAMEFLRGYLMPAEYDTQGRSHDLRGRKFGKTLDLFIREYILLGKGDVNGDGVDERFYLFNEFSWCGSIGCRMLIVEKKGGIRRIICDIPGSEALWITDNVTVNGLHELDIGLRVSRIYWHGEECYLDDPDTRDIQPDPDPLRK